MSMDQLIPVINKLQDVFNALGTDAIDLPQIVVVGSQSSGKSSVLENIVGRDFLPRGQGIVTRRPLVLQLINLPTDPKKRNVDDDDDALKEWGEFLHKPNEIFYDFNQIREEIIRETDRLSGKNKGISHIPINLKIYSPHVLNLTLVDLPGITKVPVGDQPADIEMQIRNMVLQYIEKPNAVILAVTAANTDLSNSDALQVAAVADPDGQRTIGVLTKIDLMDAGTDAMDMLLNRVIPLRLGYIGVINRSQQDIIKKKPIRAALKAEAEYFATHPLYRTVASRCGTPFLSKTLNKILMNHIKECLPELKAKINKMATEAQAELLTYGDPLYDGKNSQGALLLQVITKFSTDYKNAVEGKSTDLSLSELCGGARINYIFNDIFARCLARINPTDDMTMNDIRTAIRNATGPRAALFVPEAAFELLVRRQIQRLEDPSLQCVDLVYDELQRIIAQLESKELLRFANLRERVVEVVNGLLQKCRSPTKTMISNMIAVELAYINTNHPDFVGGGGAITQVFERMAATHAQEQQQQQVLLQQQQALLAQQQMQQPGQPMQTQPMPQPAPQPVPPKATRTPAPMSQQGSTGDMSGQQGSNGFFNMFFGGQAPPGTPQAQMQQMQQQQQQRGGGMAPATPVPATPGGRMAPPTAAASSRSASGRTVMGEKAVKVKKSTTTTAVGGRGEKLDQVPATIRAISAPTDKEKFETELIQSLLLSYFDIVRKNIQDLVPKSIMHFLVNQAKDSIQNELVANLYKEDYFDNLLEESSAVATRRAAAKSMLDVLTKAQLILNEVRESSV